jgi:pyruvate dehydrogenase E1 component
LTRSGCGDCARSLARCTPGSLTTLGADGFGRSETRARLRRFFEVDAECTVIATLHALAKQCQTQPALVEQVMKDLGVEAGKVGPQAI